MNSADNDNRDSSESLSAEYRALAKEKTPEDLDQAVLNLAADGVKRAARGNWLTARIRPLAFVVTAGLSLALLIQLSNAPVVEAPPADPGAQSLPESVFQDAARQTAEQIRELESGSESANPAPGMEMNTVQTTERPAGLSLLPVEDRCTDSDRAESEAWWECIRDLEKRGLSESAELELQALLQAHPQFSAPQ